VQKICVMQQTTSSKKRCVRDTKGQTRGCNVSERPFIKQPRPIHSRRTGTGMNGLLAFLLVCILIVISIAVQGWAVAMLWLWFVTPLGVPAITVAMGFGLVLVARALQPEPALLLHLIQPTRYKEIVRTLMLPVIMVGIGWLVHQFV
jgi:hypothetical protein